jgi:hypothetical protein
MTQDTIIEEVRATREQIAAQFDYDVTALGAYYQRLQKEQQLVVVSRQSDQSEVGGEEAEGIARDQRAA